MNFLAEVKKLRFSFLLYTSLVANFDPDVIRFTAAVWKNSNTNVLHRRCVFFTAEGIFANDTGIQKVSKLVVGANVCHYIDFELWCTYVCTSKHGNGEREIMPAQILNFQLWLHL